MARLIPCHAIMKKSSELGNICQYIIGLLRNCISPCPTPREARQGRFYSTTREKRVPFFEERYFGTGAAPRALLHAGQQKT